MKISMTCLHRAKKNTSEMATNELRIYIHKNVFIGLLPVIWYLVRGMKLCGPSLATSLEPLAHRQNVASLSLFYRCYFGRCLSELAQLVPLPYS